MTVMIQLGFFAGLIVAICVVSDVCVVVGRLLADHFGAYWAQRRIEK